MELEEKIIQEIEINFSEAEDDLDVDLINRINKLIVYESVKVIDREKSERDAITYLENKLDNLF